MSNSQINNNNDNLRKSKKIFVFINSSKNLTWICKKKKDFTVFLHYIFYKN